MDKNRLFQIEGDPDGVVWYVPEGSSKGPFPYCPDHLVPLIYYEKGSSFPKRVTCPHDGKDHELRNRYDIHQSYVRSMTKREALRDFKLVRIESSGNRVLAREKYDKDARYFIDTKLSDTPKGLELMVQVGRRDEKGKKIQLFVVPAAKRMGFDTSQKDFHPNGMFTEVKATFKDSQTRILDTSKGTSRNTKKSKKK